MGNAMDARGLCTLDEWRPDVIRAHGGQFTHPVIRPVRPGERALVATLQATEGAGTPADCCNR